MYTGVIVKTEMAAICRVKIRKEHLTPLSRVSLDNSRREGAARKDVNAHTPLSLGQQPSEVVNATALSASYLTTGAEYRRHSRPSLSTPRRRTTTTAVAMH
jgi:hypothetical protein